MAERKATWLIQALEPRAERLEKAMDRMCEETKQELRERIALIEEELYEARARLLEIETNGISS